MNALTSGSFPHGLPEMGSEAQAVEFRALVRTFRYLDRLRESGVTNMYGARPYLVRDLGMEPEVAGEHLTKWMHSFSPDESPESRATKAMVAA